MDAAVKLAQQTMLPDEPFGPGGDGVGATTLPEREV
jgi:hypothetical protein